MPVWWVSQPYISLWLKDEPLGYQPTIGQRISFYLAFKQRETTAGFVTKHFQCWKKVGVFPGSLMWGRTRTQTAWSFSRTAASGRSIPPTIISPTPRLTGNTNIGFTLSYPDGSQNVYGFIVTNSSGAFQEAFLTQSLNPKGQATTFNYSSYTPAASFGCSFVIGGGWRWSNQFHLLRNE